MIEKYILFDLDGVISDNSEGIMNGVRRVIEHFSLKTLGHDELLRFIGPPLKDSFSEYLHLPDEQLERAVGIYREYYRSRGIFENVMYDGVPDMLKRLRDSGALLYLATSKPEEFARQICARFGIDGLFEFIGGASLDGTRDRKSDVIRYVLAENAIDPRRAVMVGDRSYDALGAAELSIPCVGVLYGFGSRDELLRAGCKSLADSPASLAEHLCSAESVRFSPSV